VALRDAGASVDFLTAREAGQTEGTTLDGIRIRRRGGQLSFYAATLAHLLLGRLRGRSYDVVIDPENGIPAFAPLVVSRRTAVVLVVHHVHQQQFRTYFRRPMADLGRFLEKRVMPLVYRAAPTLVVSESTREEMVRQLGWTRPVMLVPNGTRPVPADDHVPPDGRIVVLGRLAQHKRIDLVIRVFAQLHAQRPDLRLDIVGRGPVEQELRGLVDDLGLRGLVTMHGFVPEEDKERVLRQATLQVCASDAEGWGQVVVEAAAYGVPTLARNVPGLRDSIRDGETGWLRGREGDPTDVVTAELLAGALVALDTLSDPEERRRMAEACRDWSRRFTWEAMHAQVVDVVTRELARRRG
jgi:glycosyltransferase involved in cell wall biosynthesis